MWSLFKKTPKEERLRKAYEEKLQEAYRRSKSDRKAADALYAEAQSILEQIEELQNSNA